MEQKKNKDSKDRKKPEFGIYLSIFLALGTALGVVFDSIPMGVGLGLVVGMAIDLTQKKKRDSSKNSHGS